MSTNVFAADAVDVVRPGTLGKVGGFILILSSTPCEKQLGVLLPRQRAGYEAPGRSRHKKGKR